MHKQNTDSARRHDLTRWTPAERAINDAVQEVEKAGADARLTDAVTLLQQARQKVADFVDGVPTATSRPSTGGTADEHTEACRREAEAAAMEGEDPECVCWRGAIGETGVGRG